MILRRNGMKRVAYFKVLPLPVMHWSRRTEMSHGKFQSGTLVFMRRFEPRNYRIHGGSDTV
jgi:hypothetical protein